jgi:hypothetical protein
MRAVLTGVAATVAVGPAVLATLSPLRQRSPMAPSPMLAPLKQAATRRLPPVWSWARSSAAVAAPRRASSFQAGLPRVAEFGRYFLTTCCNVGARRTRGQLMQGRAGICKRRQCRAVSLGQLNSPQRGARAGIFALREDFTARRRAACRSLLPSCRTNYDDCRSQGGRFLVVLRCSEALNAAARQRCGTGGAATDTARSGGCRIHRQDRSAVKCHECSPSCHCWSAQRRQKQRT